MKIGLDVSAALAGASGIKFYVEELLAGFARVGAGHEFVLYTAFWRAPDRLGAVRLPSAPNFRLAFKRVPQRVLLPAEEFLGLGIVEGWLRKWGVEVFHGLGNMIPPLSRVPSVVTVHHVGGALDTTDPWSLFYFNLLAERSVRRASAVVAVSEFSRREAVKAFGIPDDRAFAVHEGGPDPMFSPAEAPSRSKPGGWRDEGAPPPRGLSRPYLLYVGGILERKNLLNLISAFGRVLGEGGRGGLKLVLAGKKGNYYPAVRDFAASAGLADRIVFLDRFSKPELVELYRTAEAFVYPSLLEGFGFPVLEAMACGTPVVASLSGSIPEVAGDAAALVDCLDVSALAAAVAAVLDDKARASELRARGLERAGAFSWDKAALGTLAVYERALGRRA